jgi:hypothetical protein
VVARYKIWKLIAEKNRLEFVLNLSQMSAIYNSQSVQKNSSGTKRTYEVVTNFVNELRIFCFTLHRVVHKRNPEVDTYTCVN